MFGRGWGHNQLCHSAICCNAIVRCINWLLMDMQEEEVPKEHQETGSGTDSRVASDFPSKPEDPTRKDKSKKSEWVCNKEKFAVAA